MRNHNFEPGAFDIKEVLHPTRREKSDKGYMLEMRKTVCPMTNGDGGCILFGVKDKQHQVGSPDDLMVGIPLGGDLRKEFGEKLRGRFLTCGAAAEDTRATGRAQGTASGMSPAVALR